MATSTGDRLDAIFAELDPINQEIRKIGWTPSGRLRYRLSPEQEARLEELAERSNELASRAARIVAEEAELKALAAEKGPLATPRQVDYIWSLVCQGRHEEGGFYNGPTTLDGIRKMRKTSASIYINSLTDNY